MNDKTDNQLWYANPESPEGINAADEIAAILRPNLSVAGWPAEAGSKALENYRPPEDATVVAHARKAGGHLIGMSRMSELGFGITGETAPRLLSESRCNVFLGTDGMGEARHTAALAGAWGFKPSFGIASTLGVIRLFSSLETVGVAAASPSRLKALAAALCQKDEADFSMRHDGLPDFSAPGKAASPGEVRIGILSEQISLLDESDKNAFESAVAGLVEKGFQVEPVSFPEYGNFRLVHHAMGAVEAFSSAGKYDGVRYGHRAETAGNWNEMYLESRREAFGALIKSYLFQGAWFQFKNYPAFEHAARLRARLIEQIRELLGRVDFIASPVRRGDRDASAAGSVDDVYGAFALTLPANVAGLPSLCVPGMVSHGDTDLGLQLTGGYLNDAQLLDFAETHLANA